MNGKTIEVDNTDAEGRLILADALSYGRREGLSPMIDVATLTGAMRAALGTVCTGAFTNHPPTLRRILRAAAATGEKTWRFPMFDEYKEQNRSDVADIKNTGGANAGSITAALFLAEFSESTPWVHLDIAGTARQESTKGYLIKGSSGVPVRTLVQFVLNEAQRARR
jgi:leucyl aminopeptidase